MILLRLWETVWTTQLPLNIWSKLERWRGWVSGTLWAEQENIFKNYCLELLSCLKLHSTFSGSDSGMQQNVECTCLLVNLQSTPKSQTDPRKRSCSLVKLQNTPKSQTGTRKGSCSLSGSLLPIQLTTGFWISVRSLRLRTAQQIDEMHWKLWRLFSSTGRTQFCTTSDDMSHS